MKRAGMESATSGYEPFKLEKRSPRGFKQNLTRFIINTVMPRFLRFIGRLAPVWHLPGTNLVFVTGFDAVQEVQSRHYDFEVPYEARVKLLRWTGFILALQDTPEYHNMRDHIWGLWEPSRTARVTEIARATTESILATRTGDLDLIQGLVKPVLLAVVEQHYGLKIPPERSQSFFDANLAASGFMFSGPRITKNQTETATAAAAAIWPVIDDGLAEAREHPDSTTVLGSYYEHGADLDFPEAQIRSAVMTMIGGYLPTCTNASGRIMNVLLDRPDAMQFMQDAVRAEQDGILLTGLLEALRVDYIIPLGFRRAARDTYLGEGTTKHKPIREDRILAVSLGAAMSDRRRVQHPGRFDPDRSPTVRMVYGHEFHHCIGQSIANAVLLEIFKGLLKRRPTRPRHPKDRWVGAYPWNLHVTLHKPSVAS